MGKNNQLQLVSWSRISEPTINVDADINRSLKVPAFHPDLNWWPEDFAALIFIREDIWYVQIYIYIYVHKNIYNTITIQIKETHNYHV